MKHSVGNGVRQPTSSRPQEQVDGRQVGLDPLYLEELPPGEDGVPEARLLVRDASVQQMVEGVRRDGRAVRRHLVDDGEGRLQVAAAPERLLGGSTIKRYVQQVWHQIMCVVTT